MQVQVNRLNKVYNNIPFALFYWNNWLARMFTETLQEMFQRHANNLSNNTAAITKYIKANFSEVKTSTSSSKQPTCHNNNIVYRGPVPIPEGRAFSNNVPSRTLNNKALQKNKTGFAYILRNPRMIPNQQEEANNFNQSGSTNTVNVIPLPMSSEDPRNQSLSENASFLTNHRKGGISSLDNQIKVNRESLMASTSETIGNPAKIKLLQNNATIHNMLSKLNHPVNDSGATFQEISINHVLQTRLSEFRVFKATTTSESIYSNNRQSLEAGGSEAGKSQLPPTFNNNIGYVVPSIKGSNNWEKKVTAIKNNHLKKKLSVPRINEADFPLCCKFVPAQKQQNLKGSERQQSLQRKQKGRVSRKSSSGKLDTDINLLNKTKSQQESHGTETNRFEKLSQNQQTTISPPRNKRYSSKPPWEASTRFPILLQNNCKESGTDLAKSLGGGASDKQAVFISSNVSLKTSQSISPQRQMRALVTSGHKKLKGYLAYDPQNYSFYKTHRNNNTVLLSGSRLQRNKKLPFLCLTAPNYCVIDSETLELVLSASSNSQSIQIASVTKVLTALLAVLACEKYNVDIRTHRCRVSDEAALMPGTSAQLQSGDVLTIEQLLYGLMLPSGNDAAVALADNIGKIIIKNKKKINHRLNPHKVFVKHMNILYNQLLNGDKKSEDKIMNSEPDVAEASSDDEEQPTHIFRNPSGLSLNPNMTTPQQITLFCTIASRNQVIKKVMSTKEYTVEMKNERYGLERRVSWKNTNKLLWKEGERWEGIKTGTTDSAGACFVGKKDNYVVGVFGCEGLSRRFTEASFIVESIRKIECQQ